MGFALLIFLVLTGKVIVTDTLIDMSMSPTQVIGFVGIVVSLVAANVVSYKNQRFKRRRR